MLTCIHSTDFLQIHSIHAGHLHFPKQALVPRSTSESQDPQSACRGDRGDVWPGTIGNGRLKDRMKPTRIDKVVFGWTAGECPGLRCTVDEGIEV